MSRPKPIVLLQSVDAKSYKAQQILKSDAIYAVFYDGSPINLRSLHTLIDEGHKYKKCSFSNSGHAFNLRDKLARRFQSDKFVVVRLTAGDVVEER